MSVRMLAYDDGQSPLTCANRRFDAADGGVFGTMPSTITWLFGQQFAGGIHGALRHVGLWISS